MENIDVVKSEIQKVDKNDIIIFETEANALRKIRSLKELVFLYYKYRLKYMIPLEFSSWDALTTFVKTDVETDVETSSEKDFKKKCKAFIRKFEGSYYRDMHYKISCIKANFNADKDIDMSNYKEAIFWYKILIKQQENYEIWNSIALVKNYDQTGFIRLYKEMKSIQEKAQLVEAIGFFMDEYKKIIAQQRGEKMSDQCYDNMRNVTQRDVLDILLYFEQIPYHMVNAPQILSTSETLNSSKATQLASDYRRYLNTVFYNVKTIIGRANRIFLERYSLEESLLIPSPNNNKKTSLKNQSENNDQETPLSNNSDEQKDSSATENNHDLYGEHTVVIQYVVDELKKCSRSFYKELTVENFKSFINDSPPELSRAVSQERFKKIREDVMAIMARSPKLLQYLKDNPTAFWDFDILPL